MSTLTLTARGQVTLLKSVLRHLGIEPGGKLVLDLLPDGRATIQAAKPTGRIEDIFGMFAGKTDKVATLEEISEAEATGWAGLVR